MRLLFWNLENFGINKINNQITNRLQPGSALSKRDASIQRRSLIRRILQAANADIIIIVEVETSTNNIVKGNLSYGGGVDGSLFLFDYVWEWAAKNYFMVPPRQTGQRESVCVFYNYNSLYFTGPYLNSGNAAASVPQIANPQKYTSPFDKCLPIRTIPQNSRYNPNQSEDTLASLVIPNNVFQMNQAYRSPYVTSFCGKNGRNYYILSLHSPASYYAKEYLDKLREFLVNNYNISNNEVLIIAGDLNWNLFPKDTTTKRATYNEWENEHFHIAFNPTWDPMNPDPTRTQIYQMYYSTHLRRTKQMYVWSSDKSGTTYYPGYETFSKSNFAIDNIFYKYDDGLDHGSNPTILNPIAGSPYQIPQNNNNYQGNPNVGNPNIVLQPQISNNLSQILTATNPLGPQYAQYHGLRGLTRGWDGIGKIRSVSDHFPIVMDFV